MINKKLISLLIILSIAFSLTACYSERERLAVQDENNKLWFLNFSNNISPADVVKNSYGEAKLICPPRSDLNNDYKEQLLVKQDNYMLLGKEFVIEFHFWNDKLAKILLNATEEKSFLLSIKELDNFIKLLTKNIGFSPSKEQADSPDITEKTYRWEKDNIVISIGVTSILSETAIFGISVINKNVKTGSIHTNRKQNSIYLNKCRNITSNIPNKKDHLLPQKPLHILPVQK